VTRQAVVSEILGRRGNVAKVGGKPKEGSALRQVYDRFRRGETLTCNDGRKPHNWRAMLTQLEDFYGMEFDKVAGTRGRNATVASFTLRGEWCGPYFVPLSHIMAEEASNA
jgi:hypothetical protein